MSNYGTPHSASNGGDDHRHTHLACVACQRKKIKCDRSFPCGQCTRSSLQCVPSTRKPRTRHAGKRGVDSELRNRITKLESLVESLSGEVGLQDGTPNGESSTEAEEPAGASSPTVGRYLASPFWSSLTDEVQAIRDALEDEPGEEETDSASQETTPISGAQMGDNFDLLICPPSTIYVMPGALSEPPPQMQQLLYAAFIRNVDPMFKVFHMPTLRAFLERGEPYLGHDASAPGNRVVRAATWYCAVNTMTDTACLAQFGQPRTDLLQQYRRIVDVMAAQADLINTNDLATLQAFTVFLVSSRMTDHSRRVWTLTALVVRIARAMGLHSKQPGRTPFETELRRRLWHQIRFLDVFAAMDRATETLITPGSFDTPMPSNVNDSEFGEHSTSIPNHETGITDMGFALVAYEAVRATQRLSIPEVSPTGDTWQARLDFAENFNKYFTDKYLSHCDPGKPFERLISTVGTSMKKSMILRAVRPILRHVSSVPPRIDSPYVLQLATESLMENEKIFADPEFEQWRWLIWVQWHALAVALAGLCSIRGTELAERAWSCVERNYERQLRFVADTRHGMLWRPIEKLYKKAAAFREAGRRESSGGGRGGQQQQQQRQDEAYRQFYGGGLPASASPTSYAMTGIHPQQPHLPTGSIPLDPTMTSPPLDFTSYLHSPSALPNTSPSSNAVHVSTGSTADMLSATNGIIDMSASTGMTPLPAGVGDMSWLDWEGIMNDLNLPVTMGDLQQPAQVQEGQDWACVLHPELM